MKALHRHRSEQPRACLRRQLVPLGNWTNAGQPIHPGMKRPRGHPLQRRWFSPAGTRPRSASPHPQRSRARRRSGPVATTLASRAVTATAALIIYISVAVGSVIMNFVCSVQIATSTKQYSNMNFVCSV